MIWRALFFCTTLGACGTASENVDPFMLALTALQGQPEVISPRFAELAQAEAPALQVSFVELDTSTVFLLERRDGAFSYWLSVEGAQIVLQSGLLHSTRGLGEGLLASDLSEPLALVAAEQSGLVDRFHTYLIGDDRAETRTYRCRIDNEGSQEVALLDGLATTILMKENCRSLDQEFSNFYWVAPSSREIVLSRQWAGPELGQISTRVVPR